MIEKKKVLDEIKNYLTEELHQLGESETERSLEIQRLLTMYRFLPNREYGSSDDVVIPSALVQLQLESTVAYYFIAPQGGGLVTSVEGKPVQIITPQSPLGEALLGKKQGDQVEVEIRGSTRKYRILSIT